MNSYRDHYEHHLLLKVSAEGVSEAQDFLSGFFAEHDGAFSLCTEEEGKRRFYIASPPRGPRFATASCTPGRWRISSRWISLCGAMMTSDLSNYRRRYPAPPPLRRFYRQLDPGNCFNPGIGKMSKMEGYGDGADGE